MFSISYHLYYNFGFILKRYKIPINKTLNRYLKVEVERERERGVCEVGTFT